MLPIIQSSFADLLSSRKNFHPTDASPWDCSARAGICSLAPSIAGFRCVLFPQTADELEILAIARGGKRRVFSGVNLHVIPSGPIETNAYLLTAPQRGEAVLIDAPGDVWAEVQPILRSEKCRLIELWLTHGHWDHTQGGAEVVRATGAKVRAHPDDRRLIETPELMERFMGERLNLEPIHVDHWLKPAERLSALGLTVEVRHVPGHCPGNVLFYFATPAIATSRAAFVGDSLFAGSVGRTDLPDGSFEVLEKSIRAQIYTLPNDTVVYPGHGPDTTVEAEKATNPYVSD